MVVRINKNPEVPSVEHHIIATLPANTVGVNDEVKIKSGTYTILDALKEMPDKKEQLMLVHQETGTAYRVLGYDADTGLVSLEGSNKQRLKPRVSERECQFYYPLWR